MFSEMKAVEDSLVDLRKEIDEAKHKVGALDFNKIQRQLIEEFRGAEEAMKERLEIRDISVDEHFKSFEATLGKQFKGMAILVVGLAALVVLLFLFFNG